MFSTQKINDYATKPGVKISDSYNFMKILQTPRDHGIHDEVWRDIQNLTSVTTGLGTKEVEIDDGKGGKKKVAVPETGITYTTDDHQRYLNWKKEKLQQLQGETFKQAIREMWSEFKKDNRTAQIEYLENLHPWLKQERDESVAAIKWAYNELGKYYITGGKPTVSLMEFLYAAKTDPGLAELVGPLIDSVMNSQNNDISAVNLAKRIRVTESTQTKFDTWFKRGALDINRIDTKTDLEYVLSLLTPEKRAQYEAMKDEKEKVEYLVNASKNDSTAIRLEIEWLIQNTNVDNRDEYSKQIANLWNMGPLKNEDRIKLMDSVSTNLWGSNVMNNVPVPIQVNIFNFYKDIGPGNIDQINQRSMMMHLNQLGWENYNAFQTLTDILIKERQAPGMIKHNIGNVKFQEGLMKDDPTGHLLEAIKFLNLSLIKDR